MKEFGPDKLNGRVLAQGKEAAETLKVENMIASRETLCGSNEKLDPSTNFIFKCFVATMFRAKRFMQ